MGWLTCCFFLSVVQDNWGALKGKMFGRSLSVEGGRGKEEVRVLSEFKESKRGGGAGGGTKGSKRGEVKGGQKATCSQSPPERGSTLGSTSPRKSRRSQRGPEKAKVEKQGLINFVKNMTTHWGKARSYQLCKKKMRTHFPRCSFFNQLCSVVPPCSS